MRKRNKFSLSHYKLGTCDMGQLIPISWYEVLPGDTVQQASSVFLRFQPMVAPVMTPVRVQLWSFYVPYRLLWSGWENFRTGGPDGLDTSTPPMITFDADGSGVVASSLSDYLGVPPGFTGEHSALPYRAYFKIWSEYFRDQDLQSLDDFDTQFTTVFLSSDDIDAANVNITDDLQPFNISWEKDYFTTARPWPQKGAAVTVPVNGGGTSLMITGNDTAAPLFKVRDGASGTYPVLSSSSNIRTANKNTIVDPYSDEAKKNILLQQEFSNEAGNPSWKNLYWDNPNLTAKLSSSDSIGSINIDDFREAIALQRFQELRAQYGSRYTEFLRAMGVKSSDARLQRPEYLGGIRNTVQFSEVLQTAADGDSPVGTLRGHGIGATKSKRFRRFIEEDGLVMTLMAIRPIALYAQSLPKAWTRTVKEDYWTKELQHIGQQEVLNKEIYALGEEPDGVFGYQNRYDEYRQIPSTVCGLFRDTFDYWHLGRIFANQPTLNESFITGSPTKRVFAEQTQQEVIFMASHSVQARRLMSKNGNPLM